MSSKKCQVRVSYKFLQKCQESVSSQRVTSKSVLQKCQESVSSQRVTCKSVPARASRKRVKSEFPQECKVYSKSGSQKRCTKVSSKSVLPECQISASCQGVRQLIMSVCIAFLPQHMCQHSGSWVSFCFWFSTNYDLFGI